MNSFILCENKLWTVFGATSEDKLKSYDLSNPYLLLSYIDIPY